MDFHDETFDVDEDTPNGSEQPDYRAVVQRSGAVRLVHWVPWLHSTGPAYTLMAARDRAGIAIADLRVIRDDEGIACEVIVEFHSGGGDLHRAALIDWARTLGYGRVWFDGELVDDQRVASSASRDGAIPAGLGRGLALGLEGGEAQHVDEPSRVRCPSG